MWIRLVAEGEIKEVALNWLDSFIFVYIFGSTWDAASTLKGTIKEAYFTDSSTSLLNFKKLISC